MKYAQLLLFAATALVGVHPVQAGWKFFGSDTGCRKPAGCCDTVSCQPCMLICRPEIKTKTEKKHCWEVECDYVCVPKVQCPISAWIRSKIHGDAESCCDTCGTAGCNGCETGVCNQTPLHARIRTVRRLKKVEYECEKCVVEWHIEQCSACNGLEDCKSGCTSVSPSSCTPLLPASVRNYAQNYRDYP